MATKSATFRNILELINDVGETPGCAFDETLVLSGYTAITHKRFELAAGAVDQALDVGVAAIAVLIHSHSGPFSARLAAAETLLPNLRHLELVADDALEAVYDGTVADILLSGNGSAVADIEAIIIHKP